VSAGSLNAPPPPRRPACPCTGQALLRGSPGWRSSRPARGRRHRLGLDACVQGQKPAALPLRRLLLRLTWARISWSTPHHSWMQMTPGFPTAGSGREGTTPKARGEWRRLPACYFCLASCSTCQAELDAILDAGGEVGAGARGSAKTRPGHNQPSPTAYAGTSVPSGRLNVIFSGAIA
jgi:hypothetical protein